MTFSRRRFQRSIRHRRAFAQVHVPVQRGAVHRREKENPKPVVRRVFRIVSVLLQPRRNTAAAAAAVDRQKCISNEWFFFFHFFAAPSRWTSAVTSPP